MSPRERDSRFAIYVIREISRNSTWRDALLAVSSGDITRCSHVVSIAIAPRVVGREKPR